MRPFNEQAQMFMEASFCLLVGCACLYFALAFWLWCIDAFCKAIGLFGAVQRAIWNRENHETWWYRCATWYQRTFRRAS